MTRPPPDERPSPDDLIRGNRVPQTIAGKPADVCPYCGCGTFVNGTRHPSIKIRRYVWCRNEKCGKRFESEQEPAKLVRELGTDENPSNAGRDQLNIIRETA